MSVVGELATAPVDCFELGLDYLQPLSFQSSLETAVAASSDCCYAAMGDDESMLDSSPFFSPRDLRCLVSPSPAPSSTSCGSSADSLYDSDELSSLPSAAAYSHQQQQQQQQSQHDAGRVLAVDASESLLTRDAFEDELEGRIGLGVADDLDGGSLVTDKHRSAYELHSTTHHLQQQQQQHRQLHSLQFDAVYGYGQPDDFEMELGGDGEAEWDMDEAEEEEEEEEVDEEETATPALAAVPPAQIVQATVADPSFVPNPAFAKLHNSHAASSAMLPTPTATAALTSPSTSTSIPVPLDEQQQQQPDLLPSSFLSPPEVVLSDEGAAATAAVVKPKRKYTKRAKPAQPSETAFTTSALSAATDNQALTLPDSCLQPAFEQQAGTAPAAASNLLSASPSSSLLSPTAAHSAATAVAAPSASSLDLSSSPLSAVGPGRARSMSSEDVDDNISIISTHSHHSTQSAPLLHTAVSDKQQLPSSATSAASELLATASPAASPSPSPASSPRSAVSSASSSSSLSGSASVARPSMSFSLASLPTLPPPGKPGRKRKTALPSATAASSAADGGDGSNGQSDGSADSVGADGVTLTGEGKRMVRLQRNRASAQLSRERKKRYMGELEERMKQLLDVNCSLEAQLSSLAVENAELKKRLGDETAITPAVAVKKRVRVSRADGKRSASHSATVVTGTGRTALLMFGIFISFAIFYNLVGIDFHSDSDSQLLVPSASSRASSSSPTYTPPFAGRLLQSLRESNSLLPPGEVAVKQEPLAIEPPPALSQQQPAQSEQPHQASLALVTVDSSADNRALVVKDEHSDVVAPAERGGQHKLYEPFASYRTHNVTFAASNGSAAGARSDGSSGSGRPHYVLCADAATIQPSVVEVGSGEKRRDVERLNEADESRTAKRLRKSLGLPAAVSPSAVAFANVAGPDADIAEPSKLTLGLDDQLLLWLPSAQLQLPSQPTQPQSHNASAASTAAAATLRRSQPQPEPESSADMVQVRCQVQSLSYVSRA